MRAVWKFPLSLAVDEISLLMPQGSRPLAFDMQGDEPMLWALVDTDAPVEPRTFHITGTGHRLPEKDLLYIGTCFEKPFVWHLFEINQLGEATHGYD
jgi:hypothetical protein